MGGTATNGTPDTYYETRPTSRSGPGAGVLWIEWKYTTSRRPRAFPEPSPLQLDWLERAHHNGVLVAVVCGCPYGSYYALHLGWTKDLNEFTGPLTHREMAAKINRWVTTGEMS